LKAPGTHEVLKDSEFCKYQIKGYRVKCTKFSSR
jgi:hypothetical protein